MGSRYACFKEVMEEVAACKIALGDLGSKYVVAMWQTSCQVPK